MNILVIRTDNIGDLVCTTPLLAALRKRYPDAWIGVLTSSYSAPVLHGHPAVDEVFEYSKVKHLGVGESALGSYWSRLRTILCLRAKRLDIVLIPAVAGQSSARRFARWLGARQVITNCDNECRHEVEKVYAVERLLPDALPWPPPPCSVVADLRAVTELKTQLGLPERAKGGLRLGLHISARKPSQRWPASSYVELMLQLVASYEHLEFLLFWSPGSSEDPKHPGDDEKAKEIISKIERRLRLFPVPTSHLKELVAGISLCDMMIQSDGGAMHVAAGLGKPIVCFFGQSSAERWHPWGTPYRLLQNDSQDVSLLSVNVVRPTVASLLAQVSEAAAEPR